MQVGRCDVISYRICVLGKNLQEAESLIVELCFGNVNQVEELRNRQRLILEDGTELIAASVSEIKNFSDGKRFDEVFVGGTTMEHRDFPHVRKILDCICGHSPVPPEFRWHYLED